LFGGVPPHWYRPGRCRTLPIVSSIEQDTDPRQLAEYYRLLRDLTPAQRMKAVNAATRRMRMMAEAGIRFREPGATDEHVRIGLVRLLYGEETVRRLAKHLFP
jgi:hypothetical protein